MPRRGFATYMEHERGFHGWLVFFFVTACLGAFARGFILFQTARTLRVVVDKGTPTLTAAVVAQLVIDMMLFVAVIYGLRLFADQDPRTPTFWSSFFLSAVPLEVGSYALLAFQTTFYENTSFRQAWWDSLRDGGFRSLVLYLIWALYWMRSKRVRLTYGANAFEHASRSPVDITAQVI